MFLATINKKRRLLHVSYIGHVQSKELLEGVEELKEWLGDLPPRFRLLVDFEHLNKMDAEAAAALEGLMEALDKGGMSLVVRVIPDPSKDIGVNILGVFHYRKGMRTVTCQTFEQVVRALEKDMEKNA